MKKDVKHIVIEKRDYDKLREIGKRMSTIDGIKTYKEYVPFSVIIKKLIESFEES